MTDKEKDYNRARVAIGLRPAEFGNRKQNSINATAQMVADVFPGFKVWKPGRGTSREAQNAIRKMLGFHQLPRWLK